MKVVKILLALVLTIVAVILIAALFLKKDMHAEREVVINKPKDVVFDYIKYIKNQDNYGKWQLMDPGMHKEYSGTDGTEGFIYRWDSKKVGQGEQTISKVIPGERLETELKFKGFMGGDAHCSLTTEAVGDNQTKVKWTFDSKMSWPMNGMQLFVNMDKMLGEDFQTGLNNLKTVLEKQ